MVLKLSGSLIAPCKHQLDLYHSLTELGCYEFIELQLQTEELQIRDRASQRLGFWCDLSLIWRKVAMCIHFAACPNLKTLSTAIDLLVESLVRNGTVQLYIFGRQNVDHQRLETNIYKRVGYKQVELVL
jgi:hypothetical protein